MNTLIPEKPQILGKQLEAARESLALSVEDVSAELGIDPQALIAWENQISEPSLKELWLLAELYHRSTDYFLSLTPPLPQQINFRVTKWHSMGELPLPAKQILVQFEELCRAATHLEKLANEQTKVRIIPQGHVTEPAALAQSERLRLGLDKRPVANLRERLSNQGAWIFEIPVPGDVFSGFSWWHPDYGPCILVNASDVPGRRAFSLAHEYAHLLHASTPSICDLLLGSPEERFADRFAAAFLMPDADVNDEFRRRNISQLCTDIQEIQPLARRYGVSLQAMILKLGDLMLLDQQSVEILLTAGEPKPSYLRRPRSPTWRRRLGERYVKLASRAYQKGQVSTSKLAEYLNVDIRRARTLTGQSGDSDP